MDYFDGNTVTGLWNYAQNYAMSDNNFDTEFGPSTPGALNLVSGNTGASYAVSPTTGAKITTPISGTVSALNSKGLGTIYGDLDPAYDDCSNDSHASSENSYPLGVATGPNIGNLLNARNITWGWFQGGFAPTGTNAAGYAVCGSTHKNIGGATVTDYSPHHDPFQYYKSTANPKHLPPTSEAAIGHTDQANHQYDISHFYRHAQGREHAGGQLPQGAGLPGRSRGLLQPDRRAALPGEHDQPDREVQVLEVDGDHRHLRRLRRLVRPPGHAGRERV